MKKQEIVSLIRHRPLTWWRKLIIVTTGGLVCSSCSHVQHYSGTKALTQMFDKCNFCDSLLRVSSPMSISEMQDTLDETARDDQ